MVDNVLVVDIEATCSRDKQMEMETIEIGAVLVDISNGELGDQFDEFVRPVRNPELTTFCTELTGITQEDVDGVISFPSVYERFRSWAEQKGMDGFCSWGRFDALQLRRDCEFHGVEYTFRTHVDLGRLFAKRFHKRRGHRGALRMLRLEPVGRHHRGIDDAKSIAKMVPLLLGS